MSMHAPFLIIGNWKSNKTIDDARTWISQFERRAKSAPYDVSKVSVVLCPSFIHLPLFKEMISKKKLSLQLGAQNISAFDPGAYTGEVHAGQLKDFVTFTLIGHSERRKHLHENDQELALKVTHAQRAAVSAVYCVQDADMTIPSACQIVGYEPMWAIGTGKADTPQNANEVAGKIRQRHGNATTVVYGGSVTAENVAGYVKQANIGGVLPGGASLDPDKFYDLIEAAVAVFS